jgi:hypothetical protein
MRILVVDDLDVPIPEILKQANGDVSHALLLAASYGFAQACKDLANKDHFAIKDNDH